MVNQKDVYSANAVKTGLQKHYILNGAELLMITGPPETRQTVTQIQPNKTAIKASHKI